ncbi:SgcJ/EcaC family oxidoreductase [Bacillus sp. FJAT-27251]|uniref:SgcJ/EcaC family oxidoreductase n=1 Tax=Bacillus sp. FJAT-27251 TaxID=1684142 RepID=UPI0006A76214|nr:SgcJ/EcaC family oxidoreductase [Bacillus sp. FJAT-27251]
MEDQHSKEVQAVYKELIEAWNHQNARGMADLFAENGESIGFDGSESIGREQIFSHLDPIFEHHQTARFVSKVKNVHFLSSDIVMIRAIAGMVPPQSSDINPNVNTHHTLILVKKDGNWCIQLFQNTPAQFHGRPELVERMTQELRDLLT